MFMCVSAYLSTQHFLLSGFLKKEKSGQSFFMQQEIWFNQIRSGGNKNLKQDVL